MAFSLRLAGLLAGVCAFDSLGCVGSLEREGAPGAAGAPVMDPSPGAAGADAAGAGAPIAGGTGGAGGQPPSAQNVPDASVEASPPGVGGAPAPDVGSDGDGDFVVGPNYAPDPRNSDPTAPKGKQIKFTMTGAQSAIYKGVNGSYNRAVTVYIPSQYDPSKPAALLVTQDALGANLIPGVLDNLINKKMLPVIVAMFVANGGGDAVGSERGLEYDTVAGLYAEYVIKELVPRAVMEAKTQLDLDLNISADPEGHLTIGGSSGGAAAFSMAWWHPDYFHRVIAFSGTYVTQVPASSPFPHGCWIYHDVDPYDDAAPNGLIVQHCEPAAGFVGDSTPGPCDPPLTQAKCEAIAGCAWNTKVNRPIRIWHESAEPNDMGAGQPPGTYRNFDLANRRMAAAFKLRGYHYHYDHALNAGHVDGKVVSQTMAAALLWVWRGYPVE